jgi:hypothetical protein
MRAKRAGQHSRKERENDRAARPGPSFAQRTRSLRMTDPGLGDAESELDGASREAEFGPFAALFGVTDGEARRFHLHF